MDMREFLRPDKYKVIVALLSPYVYTSLVLLQGYAAGAAIVLPAGNPVFVALFMILGSLFESLISYPFACGVVILLTSAFRRNLNKLKSDRKGFSYVALSILIFNPLSLRLIVLLLIIFLFYF